MDYATIVAVVLVIVAILGYFWVTRDPPIGDRERNGDD